MVTSKALPAANPFQVRKATKTPMAATKANNSFSQRGGKGQ